MCVCEGRLVCVRGGWGRGRGVRAIGDDLGLRKKPPPYILKTGRDQEGGLEGGGGGETQGHGPILLPVLIQGLKVLNRLLARKLYRHVKSRIWYEQEN